jgi:hypothetical protein
MTTTAISSLALRQRRLAGREVLPERGGGVTPARIVHPDLVRPGQSAAWSLDEKAITFPLIMRHPVDGKLGVTSERRRVAHVVSPPRRIILQPWRIDVDMTVISIAVMTKGRRITANLPGQLLEKPWR